MLPQELICKIPFVLCKDRLFLCYRRKLQSWEGGGESSQTKLAENNYIIKRYKWQLTENVYWLVCINYSSRAIYTLKIALTFIFQIVISTFDNLFKFLESSQLTGMQLITFFLQLFTFIHLFRKKIPLLTVFLPCFYDSDL